MPKAKRPKVTPGTTTRVTTGCGNAYITCNEDGNKLPLELFCTLGKPGECAKCQNEALTRSITLGLKYGVPVEDYVKQLKGIKCPSPAIDEEFESIDSCPDAVAKVIEKIWVNKKEGSQ